MMDAGNTKLTFNHGALEIEANGVWFEIDISDDGVTAFVTTKRIDHPDGVGEKLEIEYDAEECHSRVMDSTVGL